MRSITLQHMLIEQRETELVDQSVVITSLEEAAVLGLGRTDIDRLCVEISDSIGEYNRGHVSEMLPKSSDVIFSQLRQGLSCLIVARDENGWRFLHHGSIYPIFEHGEEKLLGTQVVEFGSAITHKDFRVGYGLGTKGFGACLGMMKKMATSEVEIFNNSGQSVFKTIQLNDKIQVERTFPSGLYIVKATSNGHFSYVKHIVR